MNRTASRSLLGRPMIAVVAVTAVLLMVPAIAMQFTSEVNWGPGDFLVAALLLMLTGAFMVIGSRAMSSRRGKIAAVVAAGLLLAMVWAELAVGVFR